MKNILLFKKTGLLLTMSLLVSSSMTIHAEATAKKVGLGLTLATMIRLGMKAEPSKNPVTLETLPEFLNQLALEVAQGNVKNSLLLCWKMGDDLVIGFAGKPSGLKAFSSSITAEGDNTFKTINLDGKEIRLIMKEGIPPYGFVGILCSSLDNIMKRLEFADKVYKLCGNKEGLVTSFWNADKPAPVDRPAAAE